MTILPRTTAMVEGSVGVYPNPPYQHSMKEETGSRTFGRALADSFHISSQRESRWHAIAPPKALYRQFEIVLWSCKNDGEILQIDVAKLSTIISVQERLADGHIGILLGKYPTDGRQLNWTLQAGNRRAWRRGISSLFQWTYWCLYQSFHGSDMQ